MEQIDDGSEKKKIIKPTLHFLTALLKIGDDYTTDKIPVTELVMAGHVLADFPNFQRFAARGYSKAPLEPGDWAQLSEDGLAVVATVPGYPKVKTIRRADVPEPITVIAVEPLFVYSPDLMKVTLVIHPPLEGGRSLRGQDLRELIAAENIVFGIDDEALEEALDCITRGEQEFRRFIIARGQEVGQSSDAYLRYELEIGPIAGTILEDGSIDFRERRIMVGIKAGEVIATKIPAVQGAPGVSVFGEETPAQPGKDLKIELANDVRFNRDTLQVTATKSGVLSIVNNRIIKVCSHQVLVGDIDYATGNVESMNAVTIRGSVQPGFKVTVAGDLEVSGAVMSGRISAQGNLVVRGGITGKNSSLEVKGDADINFIEQGTLRCGGIAVIRKQSYYSDIVAGGDVRCRPDSKVMGGTIISEGTITLGDVGTENSTPALLAAGVVAERLARFNELKTSIVEQQEAIVQWITRYPGSSHSKKVKAMEKELAETKLLLIRLNLIPGSGIYSKAGVPEEGLVGQAEDYDLSGIIDIDRIKIEVFGTISTGTKILIGNCSLVVEKNISSRQFKLHPNRKSILAVALKK